MIVAVRIVLLCCVFMGSMHAQSLDAQVSIDDRGALLPDESDSDVQRSVDFEIPLTGNRVSDRQSTDVPMQPVAFAERTWIEVRVTASSVGSVYLDKGRSAGILPGDEVTLYPADDGIVNATIQSVSKNSARCTVVSGVRRMDVGTRGRVFAQVPTDEAQDFNAESRPDKVQHPPWTHGEQDWAEDRPLLAPAYSRSIEERPATLRGRVYSNYLHTWNRSNSQNQYSLGRLGASLWMDNPFQQGGGIRADGEFNRRGVFLQDQSDDINGPGRLDRLSYYWGGTDGRPLRLEVGRFLSYEFPEFGVIDGTEVLYRAGTRHRFGASVGALPEPFPNLSISNDLHVALFYRWVSDPNETFSTGVGYQKTWHQATPDRDLLVWTSDYTPNQSIVIHGGCWCDFYDSHDTLKSTDFEVTQAIFQPFLRLGQRRGIGGHISYVRWPQLLRREFSPFVQQRIIADRLLRVGTNFWQDLRDWLQLTGRVDYWQDQDHQTGTNWETRLACRDVIFKNSEVALAVYYADGLNSTGPGARISYYRSLPWCVASLAFDTTSYRIGNQLAASGMGVRYDRLQQHSLQANFDFRISVDKSVNVFTDYRFGRQQNAFQTGLFFQKRF